MMYPVRRLAELLNQATTMDDIVRAAQYCVMLPLRADALVLTSASQDRLWVLGHSGASSGLVRNLHGARLDSRTLAADAYRGRPCTSRTSRPSLSDWDDTGSRAEACLPLTGSGELLEFSPFRSSHVIGVCTLSFEGPREFPPEERTIMTMLAGLLGAAVERVELGVKQREIAEYLQRSLLPSALPESPGLTTSARYRPATVTSTVGGDWYDVIRLPGERVVLVVGDVEGHGIDSAAVMGQVRTAVTAYATEGHSPTAVIDRTCGLLIALGTGLTVTCCVVVLDTVDGTVEVASMRPPRTAGPAAGRNRRHPDRPRQRPARRPRARRLPGPRTHPGKGIGPDAVLRRTDRLERTRPAGPGTRPAGQPAPPRRATTSNSSPTA